MPFQITQKVQSFLTAIQIKQEHPTKYVKQFPFCSKLSFLKLISNHHIQKKTISFNIGVVTYCKLIPALRYTIHGLFDSISSKMCKLFLFEDGFKGVIKENYQILQSWSDVNKITIHTINHRQRVNDIKHSIENVISTLNLDSLLFIVEIDSISKYNDKFIQICKLNEYISNVNTVKTAIIPCGYNCHLYDSLYLSQPFGYDSCLKHSVYHISQIYQYAKYCKNMWYFITIPSSLRLLHDIAIFTHPNILLFGPQILSEHMLLHDIVNKILDTISDSQKSYGLVLLTENLMSYLPSISKLIKEIEWITNEHYNGNDQSISDIPHIEKILKSKSYGSWIEYKTLPKEMQVEMMLNREQTASCSDLYYVKMEPKYPADLLIKSCMKRCMKRLSWNVNIKLVADHVLCESYLRGSCASKFDVKYAYCLGRAAVAFLQNNVYDIHHVICISNVCQTIDSLQWSYYAVPFTHFLQDGDDYQSLQLRKHYLSDTEQMFDYIPHSKINLFYDLCDSNDTGECPIFHPIQFYGPKSIIDSPLICNYAFG